MNTTFTFAANVGLYGLFTSPKLGYRSPSYLQTVTYNLSLKPGASSLTDTFSPITTATQASSMLPVYLTIEAIPVNPPGFAITDVGFLQPLTPGSTTPVPPITVARFYIENDNIPQSFSYPSQNFTEMLTSLTYTDSRDIKVNITGYGWYRADSPSLGPILNTLQMYFANQTKYNFEVNIYDVNCPGCDVTAKPNVLNIFDGEDGYALTNFQVSAGMFYTFNTNTTLIDATDLGIVVSGLDLISRYTFTFGLHSVPFFGNQIFDVTGNFVCKLSYSLSANIVAVSMY